MPASLAFVLAAYLIEPGRATYELDDLAAEYDVDVAPEPETEEETAALVRLAAPRPCAARIVIDPSVGGIGELMPFSS